jgi:hypothetical protein
MNAEDMPVANKDSLNQEERSKPRNQGNSYLQNGNLGIGHMSDGEIKNGGKVAGKIEENHDNQSQNTNNQFTVNISTSSESNSLKKPNNLIDHQNTIEMYIKEGDKEASIKTPYSAENFQSLLGFLQQRFNDNDLGYEDIKKSSIKLILKGSEEGLKNIAKSFKSGELAPLLKQQFNLELEDAQLIDSDSSQRDRSQKLLAFTIAGDVSQANIDILKSVLIDTPDNNEEGYNEEKSRLARAVNQKRIVASYTLSHAEENRVFNSSLEEFAKKTIYICNLESSGKLSPEKAYKQIKSLWKQLKRIKTELGIGRNIVVAESRYESISNRTETNLLGIDKNSSPTSHPEYPKSPQQ